MEAAVGTGLRGCSVLRLLGKAGTAASPAEDTIPTLGCWGKLGPIKVGLVGDGASALLVLGRGCCGLGRAASLWCGVKGMMADGAGSPQSPPWHDVPAAVAPEGAIPLHQRGSDLVVGQAAGCGCSRSLLPSAAGWVLLSMPCSSTGHCHCSPVAQPLSLLTLIFRDWSQFCSVGLGQGKPLTGVWVCTIL